MIKFKAISDNDKGFIITGMDGEVEVKHKVLSKRDSDTLCLAVENFSHLMPYSTAMALSSFANLVQTHYCTEEPRTAECVRVLKLAA